MYNYVHVCLYVQGWVEAYDTHARLVAKGIDPTRLMGAEVDERDEFSYEDKSGTEEKEGDVRLYYTVCNHY